MNDTVTTGQLVLAIIASGGFWAVIQQIITLRAKRKEDKNSDNAAIKLLLMGVAHDIIKRDAEAYIARGYVTTDEYEDLCKYLYEPYRKMGGNGSAEHMMEAVKQLPIR